MRKELIIMSVGTNTGTEKAAIYARLSVEDIEKDSDGSRSIGNQISLLKDYCAEHGYNVYDTYVDDGISGTERNRPDFQRMLKATPHKDRLRALRHIYLQIFRHIAQIYLEIR